MKFRHELKYTINYSDYLIMRQRLRYILAHDKNAGENGAYFIRSIYFDTPEDKALADKINGLSRREKFRLRFYNMDTSFINLEKKSKRNQLGNKVAAPLTCHQAQAILTHDIAWMYDSEYKLIQELYAKMKNELLRPKTIVDYIREPFIFPAGNVRITLDRKIRTGKCGELALTNQAVTIPDRDDVILLEVKYDEFLPDLIRDLVQLESRRAGAFSKYAACRIYGYSNFH